MNTVAPVVVRPDIDSKIASVSDSDKAVRRNTAAPRRNVPRTVQNAATTRKPSRNLRSLRERCTGSQMTAPAASVSPKPFTNGSQDWSVIDRD